MEPREAPLPCHRLLPVTLPLGAACQLAPASRKGNGSVVQCTSRPRGGRGARGLAARRVGAVCGLGACCRRAWLRHRTRGDGSSRAGDSPRRHRARIAATANGWRRPAAAPRLGGDASGPAVPQGALGAPPAPGVPRSGPSAGCGGGGGAPAATLRPAQRSTHSVEFAPRTPCQGPARQRLM